MATELFPIIATADIGRSLGFYRDLLGGTVSYEFAGPDGAPAYVGHDPAAAAGGRSVSLWIYTDDVDATIERLRAAGVAILDEPLDQRWGERVAKVEDPDGTQVHVASR